MIRQLVLSFSAVLMICAGAWAQTVDDTSPPATPEPDPIPWTYGRQAEDGQRPVTNGQTRWHAEDGSFTRQHVVTGPGGEMTQLRERTQTQEGYQYRQAQTWTDPAGNTLRQHEHALSVTDPNNHTRTHTVTLPDGRIVSQTRTQSWDGTTGTRQRSFVGPNGQLRERQRNWSPDGQLGPESQQPVVTAARSGNGLTAPVSAPVAQANKAKWWQRLNPFRSRGRETSSVAATAPARRGFSVGTPRRSGAATAAQSRGQTQRVQGSQSTHRPSWAGGARGTITSQVRSANAHGQAMSARPNPGRGSRR